MGSACDYLLSNYDYLADTARTTGGWFLQLFIYIIVRIRPEVYESRLYPSLLEIVQRQASHSTDPSQDAFDIASAAFTDLFDLFGLVEVAAHHCLQVLLVA